MNLTKDEVIKNSKLTIDYVIKNISNFEGRTARAEFWYAVFITFIATFIVNFLLTFIVRTVPALSFLFYLVQLAGIAFMAAISVRRFHDIDKPGIWALLNLVLVGLYFCYMQGSPGANTYGAEPDTFGSR